MWKYQHPDFALFLLGELQKQQQGSIFCDTLLQTEGVCVPAHSCVLGALSPVFSRIFSTSPAPQAGQNRLLSLEAIGSHALLKLVGFLYTGEMEIESQSEHEEIMAAAHRLGLRNLFDKKRVWVDRGFVDVGRRWKETGVQTEDSMTSQESEIVSEPLKIQSSTAPVQTCGLLEPDLPPSQLFDETNPTRGLNLINNVTVPSLADMTEASVSNHHKTKAKKRWKMAKRESQLKFTQQQNQIKLLNVEETKSNQIGVVEKSRTVSGKDFQKLLQADNGQKNTTAEQKEAKLDRLKVKIKLRRRSGACWESNLLVSVQGESEKKPEEVKECEPRTPSYPSSVLRGQSLETLTPPTDLPISPSNSSTHASSDKCLHTPHHISVSSPLDIPALSPSPPQADESDEHIAMLLEDMFMMGLNILPLVPLDRNLNEQDQLDPLHEQKGGQMATEASAQGACLLVQSLEPEKRKSDVSKTETLVGSPGQGDKDHDQSRSNTVELVTHLPKQEHLNQNLATLPINSTPSFTEGFNLTPKATAVPDSVTEGEMPSLVMTSILDDRPDFKLLKCLSPLESEKEDSDVPSKQEPSKPSETQNFPLWLSESPLILDFPLRSMIDSSCPSPQRDLNACQNRSCFDLAEMQELKTSFSHNDLISGSSSNIVQPDGSDASEHPKQRKTRKRRRATQKSKVKGNMKCQNLENEDRGQPRISECEKRHCGNIKPSNSDTYGISTRMTRRVAAGMKRRRDVSSPLSKKMPTLNMGSKQCEHLDVLPKTTLTGVVKRRGRAPKPKPSPVAPLCKNTKKLPTSGQDDCEVEKTKADNEIWQEPNLQQKKDSTEMEEMDVNSNFAQATPNSHLKYAGQVKGPSILDQIFHQALPRVGSPACRSPMNIDEQLTPNLRNTSLSLQKFQGGKSEDVNSKLVMNSSEQINKGICAEEKKAEMSTLINGNEDVEVSDNQSRSPLSCGDMPGNVKCSVKDGDFSMVENSTRTATVLQNSDFQNEMGTDIQDLITSEEDMMTSVEDIDDADHDLSNTKMDCVVATNELIVEGIEINCCMNPESAQAEHLGDEQNSEATDTDECLFEMISDSEKTVDTRDFGWVADCREYNEKEDLGRHEEDQTIEENIAGEETEVLTAQDFVEENALLDSNEEHWETTSGLDDDGIDVEEAQYTAEMIDEQTLLEEEEFSQGHIASAKIADDPSKGACPREISTDAPSEGSNFHTPSVCNEDVSMLLSVGADSESKDDCHLDEEDIEVDVLGESVEEFPLELLAARQAVTLTIEDLLEQEDELDTTEEEDVDVTGEETE